MNISRGYSFGKQKVELTPERRIALLQEELKVLEAERDRWADRVLLLERRLEEIREIVLPDVPGTWGVEP